MQAVRLISTLVREDLQSDYTSRVVNLDATLSQLEAAQLLRRLDELELEYIFKHALVQEAAYGSLLKTTRAGLHQRVAEVIERLNPNPDQREQHAALLAMHYTRAGVDEKAFDYAALAGDQARKMYANQEALMHYALALETARRSATASGDAELSARTRAVYVHLGIVLEAMGNYAEAVENYKAMITSALNINNLTMQADGMNHLNTTRIIGLGATLDIESKLDSALALSRQANDSLLIGRALWNYGLLFRFRDPPRAIDYLQQALDTAQTASLSDHSIRQLAADTLTDLGVTNLQVGRLCCTLDYGQQAADAHRALDNKHMLAGVLGDMALTSYYQGKLTVVRALNEECAQIGRAIENPWSKVYSEWTMFDVALDRGEYDRVLAEFGQRIAAARKLGFSPFIGIVLGQTARAHLALDQMDRALALAKEAAGVL